MKNCHTTSRFKSESTIHTYEKVIKVVEPVAPEATAHQLVSFSVTVDSVVATAHVIVDDSHHHLSIHWGDDQVEIINLRKLRNATPRIGHDQEPNTLTIQHAYRAPFDQGRRIIIAVSEDFEGRKSYDNVVIEIDQRFKLSFRNIVLEFPDHLDSGFEAFSEMDVQLRGVQNSRVFFSNRWKEDVLTAPNIPSSEPIRLLLNGSAFTHEIKYSDEPVSIQLYLAELDGPVDGEEHPILDAIWDIVSAPFRALQYIPLPAKFDTSVVVNHTTVPFNIHPNKTPPSTTSIGVFKIADREGKVYAHFKYDLDLIVPLDRSLQKVMAHS